MDSFSISQEFPSVTLIFRRIQQPREPNQRRRDATTIAEKDNQLVIGYPQIDGSRRGFSD